MKTENEEPDEDFWNFDDEDSDEPDYWGCSCGWVGGKKPIWNWCPKCNAIVEEGYY